MGSIWGGRESDPSFFVLRMKFSHTVIWGRLKKEQIRGARI